MIISRKVAVSAIMSALALVAVWAAKKYLQIEITPEQAMGALLFVAASAGWITKEDARVAEHLTLKGKHRQRTVADLVEQREADTRGGLYDTSAMPALHRE